MCYGGCDCARCNPQTDAPLSACKKRHAEIIVRFQAGEGLAHLARLHKLTLLDVERIVRDELKRQR